MRSDFKTITLANLPPSPILSTHYTAGGLLPRR
jgi:hypothetical protein